MARRWQFSLWVLAGLTLAVLALWDSATATTLADQVGERTETVEGSERRSPEMAAPSELPFGGVDESSLGEGDDANLLRPTTTTTTRPTTTPPPTTDSSTQDNTGLDGAGDPGSATTSPTAGDGADDEFSPTTGSGEPSSSISGRPPTPDDGPIRSPATVYYENFAAGSLDGGSWEIYHAVGHAGWGLRRRSAVTVVPDPTAAGGAVLQITAGMGSGDEAGQLVSGGMKLLDRSLSYGRYTFRARVDADPDEATSGVVQLWPADDGWPDGGEINIMETWANRATRTPPESALHWAENGQHKVVGRTHGTATGSVSATDWHIYKLDWGPDRVSVAVDGSEPLVLSSDPSHIPQGPMDLTIQLDAFDTPSAPGEQPTLTGEVRLMVDWIRIEQFGSES